MNDETTNEQSNGGANGSSNESKRILDEIQARLDAGDLRQDEFNKMMLRFEFQIAKDRQQANERMTRLESAQIRTQKHLEHITGLVSFFGDKLLDFNRKFKRTSEIFAENIDDIEDV